MASDDIYILGINMTKFGKYPDKDTVDLAAEAVIAALADGGVTMRDMGVLAAGCLVGQGGIGQQIQKQVGQTGIPVYNVSNACATGATALRTAIMAIKAGECDMGLAVGVEKLAGVGLLGGGGSPKSKSKEWTPSGRFGSVKKKYGLIGTATKPGTLANLLVHDALEEMRLSANSREKEGIKERVSFRLERLVAACGRNMSSGTGVLATIGSTAPFVGLFGTVWGIMNSFIGIAKTQTTNLAVVAPGIAEALLATALGLVAAIPAVVIYNVFARSIAGYKAQVSDASAEVLLLVSRDLDHLPGERSAQPHMVKVG